MGEMFVFKSVECMRTFDRRLVWPTRLKTPKQCHPCGPGSGELAQPADSQTGRPAGDISPSSTTAKNKLIGERTRRNTMYYIDKTEQGTTPGQSDIGGKILRTKGSGSSQNTKEQPTSYTNISTMLYCNPLCDI